MTTRRLIIAAITASTFLKVYLAVFTIGTNDVVTWHSFLSNIREVGGAGAYHLRGVYGDPFNHPPFMIHVLLVLGWISDRTQLGFPLLLRISGILADIGSVFLMYRMQRVGLLKC